MIPTLRYAGERVIVMGLGKSGLSAAAALRAGGADVRVWDDKAEARASAAKQGYAVFDFEAMNLDAVRVVVWSPGVPHMLPKPHVLAEKARAANIRVVCDIELLAEAQRDAAIVAITGTNGKSTTTALIGHLMRHAGRKTCVGGNLGTPALDLDALGLGQVYVLELSSYQLELTPNLGCETAILLNVTPDHIDRHGDIDGYVAAKRNIFKGQRHPRTAVIGVDDDHCAAIYEELRREGMHQVVPISARRAVPGGVYVDNGILIDATDSRPVKILDLRTVPTLPGAHNWQNAAAATAAARAQGVAPAVIASGLKTFGGLPHRQELVAVVDGVAFINDSKATNADATEKALLCYENIYWIAGGKQKEGGIAPLKALFPRIRHAFLIGESADDFADTLEGKVPLELYDDLETAVEEAGEMALKEKRPGATVLLSPACASFDMFKNFEERGDRFRAEVLALWPQSQKAKA